MLPEDATILKEYETRDIEEGEVFKNGSVESDTRNLPAYVRGYEAGKANIQDVYTNEKMEEDTKQVEGDRIGDSALIGGLFTKALMLTPSFQTKANSAVLHLSNLTEYEKEDAPRHTREYLNCLLSDKDILLKFCNAYQVILSNFSDHVVNVIRGGGEIIHSERYIEHNEDISGYCLKFVNEFKEIRKTKDENSRQIRELENSFYKTVAGSLDKSYKEYLTDYDNMSTMKLSLLELHGSLTDKQRTIRLEKMAKLKHNVDLIRDVIKMTLVNLSQKDRTHPMREFIDELSEVKKFFQEHEIIGSFPPRSLHQLKGLNAPPKKTIDTEILALAKELAKKQNKLPKRIDNRKGL